MARVFSGVQPTGAAHIGNYLGAFRQFRPDPDHLYCIVDLHAITLPHDPEALRRDTRYIAGILIALGLHRGSTVFVQSHVPAHAEMMWLLSSVASTGELGRMTQYKVKAAAQGRRGVPSGLFMYPVLMAADILLYHTDEVPVGEDQTQHVELARDLALRFNSRYGETFTVPRLITPKVAARVMSLTHPLEKMSKSAEDPDSKVLLTDSPDEIRRKVMKSVTDSGREVRHSPEDKPGISNLLEIMSAFTGTSVDALAAEYGDKGYGTFKKAVAEAIVEGLRPLQHELDRVLADPFGIDAILRAGREHAAARAEAVLRAVKEKMGFAPPA